MRHLCLLFCTLCCTVLSAPAWANDWTTTSKVLIQPGKAAGAVLLGRPVPAEANRLYGAPASRTEPEPGAKGKDTGSLVFGHSTEFEVKNGMLVKLNDGKGDQNVYVIYLRGLRAYTAEGATLGMTMAKARKVYPAAKVGIDELSGGQTLAIPGLTMVFSQSGKMLEMVVHR